MINSRRTFLKASMATSMVAVAAGAGLLAPRDVLAAWPQKAFDAKKINTALEVLNGSSSTTNSNKITVEAPDIAENGAVVSVTVKTSIPNAESISVLVAENASPLCASYILTKQSDGFVTGRIKMRKTSDVVAVVKAGGKLLSAKKPVKVTLGGCGG
ncbi:MAG: thiosulfate oxidation carrier protein SoxY [Gammaproteobacteria bacterium]|nr:thiosulfate oxidation carrier protein SoxY [Gammaproteobacteria bacterium]MDH5777610.1 thiosulfate oxidation carrier protein SoxY [Gammaproteobacteria bacterium]